VAAVMVIIGTVGFIGAFTYYTSELDNYAAYGEVPLPASAAVHLPVGEVDLSFVAASAGGGNLEVPPLSIRVTGPGGTPELAVSDERGRSRDESSPARVQVAAVQVPEEAVYTVEAAGEFDGYVEPRLAFGYTTSNPFWAVLLFAVAFPGLMLAGTGVTWLARAVGELRARRQARSAPPPYLPTSDGSRDEGLKTIMALRDSGAMTENEYRAEKRRILRGR
jgi:hypothetical protein